MSLGTGRASSGARHCGDAISRVGRKTARFESSGEAASIAYTLIESTKMNGLDPQAWLTEVVHRIPEHPNNHIDELLPWN